MGMTMRKLFALIFVIFLGQIALAQTPRVEVFGGYSYLHEPGLNLNGWNGSATFNLNRCVGITADFSGHYWSTSLNAPLVGALEIRNRVHSYTFGPTVSLRNQTRFTPFVRLLAGGSHLTFAGTVASSTGSASEDHFTVVGGGGFDVALNRRIAVRPVQLDYHGVRFSPGWMNSMRYSAGVVFRLGEKK